MDSSPSIEERSEIVFFDVETTIPSRKGQCFYLLEFGAILVCPRRLTELHHYSTLVKPADLFAVSTASVRCNGITRDAVATAPNFVEVADIVYEILHGRVWAGHNIVRFDCVRIREAFAAIGRPAPEPKGTIDTLTLLTERFGRRAGDMKMATLATYFGLGEQPHRTLGDVRMNLEVVKYCSTVLFLESCLPNILSTNSSVSPNTTTRSQTNNQTVSPSNANTEPLAKPSPFDMGPLIDQIKAKPKQTDARMEEIFEEDSPVISANAVANEGCSGYAGFFDPDEVSVPSVSASLVSSYWGQRIQFLHKDDVLQLCCAKLRVRFGMSKKFVDSAGRQRLSFVVDSPSSVCRVLDLCDHLAERLSVDSGSSSTWRPAVTRKNDFLNTTTIRLNIPAISNGARGNSSVYSTEIYQKDAAGTSQKLEFHKFDANQLGALFVPGAFLDAFFSLDVYDYQQSAGIRLVAKKLIIHT